MKILFCTNSFGKITNGPAKFASLLAKNYKDNNHGFECRILTEDAENSAIPVYKLDLKIRILLISQFTRMWMYFSESRMISKSFPFDYVIYNNAYIGLLSLLFNRKTVGMINDDNNVISGLSERKLSKRTIQHYLEKAFCKISSNRIIVNSQFLKDSIVKTYHIPPAKIAVFNKGIEESLASKNRALILEKKEKGSILFTKTDYKRGGLENLIAAADKTGIPLKIGIVGPAAADVETLLKQIRPGKQLEITCYGFLPSEKVHALMEQYEIFSVPSRREAFGVANLEALACGCKIVSTNAGGIPEALAGAPLVWLGEPGSEESLTSKLSLACRHEISEAELNGLDEFLSRFSEKNLISNFRKVVQDIRYSPDYQ